MPDVERRAMPASLLVMLIILAIILLAAAGLLVWNSQFNQRQHLTFQTVDGPLVNPLIGWAPWATGSEILQPHTLVYADLTWRDFEPVEGQFDYAAFEQRIRLQKWRSENVRLVFRFMMDVPRSEEHIDIPDWLYEKINGDGDHYNVSYGKGFSPNYANPILIAAHQKAVEALGKAYASEDVIAYIQMGSLGHWGEWHIKTDAGLRPMPGEAVRNQYVEHFLKAFPNTHLMLRRPFRIAKQRNLGLYNDMTGDAEATQEWLDWISNGGEYSQTGEQTALAPMPDGWKHAPIGGEQAGSVSEDDMYDVYLPETLRMLSNSHASFIGPRSPVFYAPDSRLQPGLNAVSGLLGYRFWVSKADLPVKLYKASAVTGSAALSNSGIAPIYYNWPVEFVLINQDGHVLSRLDVNARIFTILPGEQRLLQFSLPLRDLPDGLYSVGISILDPRANQPAIQLAMVPNRDDRIQVLGSFQLYSKLLDFLSAQP